MWDAGDDGVSDVNVARSKLSPRKVKSLSR